MKKLVVMALAAMLIFTACAGGTAKSEAPAASRASSSKAESKKESNNPFADDIGYVKLMAALKEQGEVKIKGAHYWTIEADGKRDNLGKRGAVMGIKEVELYDAKLDGDIATVEFGAYLQNDLFYIEEQQHIIAKLKKTGDKYEFIESSVMGDLPATIQPNEPFTVDSLYDTGAVLSFTLYDEELKANRERLIFNDSITVNKLTGSTAWDCEVVIPLTRGNVKSIELVPDEFGSGVQSLTEVKFYKKIFTLQNDIILTSNTDIELHTRNENKGKWLPTKKFDDGYHFVCSTKL